LTTTGLITFLVVATTGAYAQQVSLPAPTNAIDASVTESGVAKPSTAKPNADGSVTITNNDPAIVYSAGGDYNLNWNFFSPAPENYAGSEHSSNFVRPTAQFNTSAVVNFVGTSIIWLGKKGPNYGFASYSIDGGPPTTVNNFNEVERDRHQNVAVYDLAFGPHVLAITLLNETAGSDHWQTIDAFTTDGWFVAPDQGSSAGYDSSSGLAFKGVWGSGPAYNGSDLSGGHYWSNQPGSSISWTFEDKSVVEVYGRPDYEDGYMDVFIDNNYVTSVDGWWGDSDDDSLNSCLLYAGRVGSGKHTITVQVRGEKNRQARDTYIQIDEFMAF
jgi:hypothetical protein